MAEAVVTISMAEEIAPVTERVMSLEQRVSALETLRAADNLAYRPNEAASLVGLERRHFMTLVERGEIEARKAGKPVLVTRQALIKWLDGLPRFGT